MRIWFFWSSIGPRPASLLDDLFDKLNEMRRLRRGGQLGRLFLRMFSLAVFEAGGALHRLIENVPKSLQTDLFGRLSAAFSDGRLLGGLLRGLNLARLGRVVGLAQLFPVQYLSSHSDLSKQSLPQV